MLQKGETLLVVEVKGRSSRFCSNRGVAAFDQRKRRCLAKAINCWRADHPEAERQQLQVVLALVPLCGRCTGVRWLPVDQLG